MVPTTSLPVWYFKLNNFIKYKIINIYWGEINVKTMQILVWMKISWSLSVHFHFTSLHHLAWLELWELVVLETPGNLKGVSQHLSPRFKPLNYIIYVIDFTDNLAGLNSFHHFKANNLPFAVIITESNNVL